MEFMVYFIITSKSSNLYFTVISHVVITSGGKKRLRNGKVLSSMMKGCQNGTHAVCLACFTSCFTIWHHLHIVSCIPADWSLKLNEFVFRNHCADSSLPSTSVKNDQDLPNSVESIDVEVTEAKVNREHSTTSGCNGSTGVGLKNNGDSGTPQNKGTSNHLSHHFKWQDQLDDRDDVGRFLYLEGVEYIQARRRLFPKIELNIQRDFAKAVLSEDGRKVRFLADGNYGIRKFRGAVPHDLGTHDPWNETNAYNIHDTSKWKDLNPKFVLQVYRDFAATGDMSFGVDVWPAVCTAMEYMEHFDRDDDGLIENDGFPDQTYDTWTVHGKNQHLKRNCGMALISTTTAGRVVTVSRYKRINWQDNGTQHLQAWRKIYDFNVMKVKGGRMGEVNGMHPNGKVDETCMQSREIWTRVTYAVAANMILAGMEKEAFTTAEGIFSAGWSEERFGYWFQTPEAWTMDGHFRSFIYMRPLAIWGMQWALSIPRAILEAPKINMMDRILISPATFSFSLTGNGVRKIANKAKLTLLYASIQPVSQQNAEEFEAKEAVPVTVQQKCGHPQMMVIMQAGIQIAIAFSVIYRLPRLRPSYYRSPPAGNWPPADRLCRATADNTRITQNTHLYPVNAIPIPKSPKTPPIDVDLARKLLFVPFSPTTFCLLG
ncbi:glutathione-disulfide reductase family protein [Hibiscus syriacus]|uniref:Glutathione-disulfide reductase family protein n=1 Tax=Hibiscus syriacus TaxID=106335 RepID=A0A6A3A2M0_HIBSY|nr:glutathione-disulfide reductase family protein [Hibiscus syriacus]